MGFFKKKSADVDITTINHNVGDKMNFAGQEAFNVLRTNVSFAIPGNRKGKTIGMTSSIPHEGKSHTTINLAYSLAKNGQKTLLISADMRKPTLEMYIPGIPLSPGLSDVLVGNVPLDLERGTPYHTVLHENLFLLTAGSLPPNPSELIGSAEFGTLLDTLKAHFDYIVIDLPPVTAVIDPVLVSRYVDGMILVIKHKYSKRQALKRTLTQLKYANAHVLGFVYNGTHHGMRYFKRGYGEYYRNKSE